MLGTIGETILQETLGQWVVTGADGATGQIGVRAGDMFLPSRSKARCKLRSRWARPCSFWAVS